MELLNKTQHQFFKKNLSELGKTHCVTYEQKVGGTNIKYSN